MGVLLHTLSLESHIVQFLVTRIYQGINLISENKIEIFVTLFSTPRSHKKKRRKKKYVPVNLMKRIRANTPPCDSITPAFEVSRRLQPQRKKQPPCSACPQQQLYPWADTDLRFQSLTREKDRVQPWQLEELLLPSRTIDSLEAKRFLNQLEQRGVSPFLHPVPEEVGDYIHVYWSNHFRDYLSTAHQRVEDDLQLNWSYYHTQPLPAVVQQTYTHYLLEPAFTSLSHFICSNDYREFYLTAELITELVEEALHGNIVQPDSIRYLLRVLEVHPLAAVLQLYRSIRDQPISSSAERLVQWLEEQEETSGALLTSKGEALPKPVQWRQDVQRLFLMELLWLRLYPQRKKEEYERELRAMLETEQHYQRGQMRQLLAYRLRNKDYYDNLLQEWSKLEHAMLGVTENARLFLQELQLFTIPFSSDTQQVREPVQQQSASGVVVVLVHKEVNPVVHPLLTNVFLPLPPFSEAALSQLLTTQLKLERRICGKHQQHLLEEELRPFRDVSGMIPTFQTAPLMEHVSVQHRPAQPLCSPLALSATVTTQNEPPRPRLVRRPTTYLELARHFVSTLNSINRDDLRQLYADSYSDLTQNPYLLSYTTAYGAAITERLLQAHLRAQIQSQLERFWNSVEARFVFHEKLTPAYTLLALALHPSFHVFLTEEEQELVSRAWEGFEASVQPFVQSTNACKPSLPVTRQKELRCVLLNSALLMKQTPQQLRTYLGKDIVQGA